MIGWVACVLAQAAAPQPAPLQTALPPGATPPGVGAAARPVSFPALQAGLGNMRGLALDGRGGVYVTSEELGLVFHVDPTGSLTIVAGRVRLPHERGWDDGTVRADQVQPAAAVALMAPAGLALDRQQRLLVADRLTRRIRRIDLTSGLIETVAGADGDGPDGDGGPAREARFVQPVALADRRCRQRVRLRRGRPSGPAHRRGVHDDLDGLGGRLPWLLRRRRAGPERSTLLAGGPRLRRPVRAARGRPRQSPRSAHRPAHRPDHDPGGKRPSG